MRAILILGIFFLSSCSSFKAERVDNKESDERALEITDKWVQKDTEQVIKGIIKKLETHKGYLNYRKRHGKIPVLFIGEVKNLTSDTYFPISDLNDELLNEMSASGEFTLVDQAARENLLKEITYQNNGMVEPSTVKTIGKHTGADLIIFGNIYMKAETREGKTIRQYSVNFRMTDIEKGIEVFRGREKVSKYSEAN